MKSTVAKCLQGLEQEGNVCELSYSGRPKSAYNEEKSLDVLQTLTEAPLNISGNKRNNYLLLAE